MLAPSDFSFRLQAGIGLAEPLDLPILRPERERGAVELAVGDVPVYLVADALEAAEV